MPQKHMRDTSFQGENDDKSMSGTIYNFISHNSDD